MRLCEQLEIEAKIKVLSCTIKKVITSLEYHKCLACQRIWQSHQSMANQVNVHKNCSKNI